MIKPTLIYGMASVLPSILGFVLLPLYSRHLSTSEYGVIAAMGVLSSVISVFANLSLDRAAFRFYFDSADREQRRRVLGTFFIGSIGVSILVLAALLLARPWLVMSYPDIDFYPYYFLTILTVVFNVCEGYVMGYLRISEQPRPYFLMMLVTVLLQAAFILYFVMVEGQGALGQIRALLLSALVLLPVYLRMAYQNFTTAFDWTLFKQGASFSWPFIPTLLIAWVLNWSDSAFIANYGSMSEVGLYAMAYKISMVFFLVTSAFSIAYQPVFFRKAEQADQVAAKKDLYAIIHVASRAFIVCGLLLALFSEDIARLLLDAQYKDIPRVIRIILLSHILSAIMGISSNLYYLQSKRSQLQLAVVSASAMVNVLLNYLLVPTHGMHGAAFATVLSMVFLTITHYTCARRCYFIEIFWWKLAMLIGASAATVWLFQEFVEGLWFSLPVKILFVAVLFIAMSRNEGVREAIRNFRAQ